MEERRKRQMMKLYWPPRSRSFSSLWLMEETGQPYERVLTDISKGAQKTPEYLAINPMGKVPALRDGEATLAEAAAICAYVAERYPEAKLAPACRRARHSTAISTAAPPGRHSSARA
jgi:glutathione S-transferase